MESPAWHIRSVTVRVGAMTILDRIDLDLRPGELVALVGPSGAGKTTLLRVLAGMIRPDSGRVVLDGREASWGWGRSERARIVGMMQQRLDLVGSLSVRNNVQVGLIGQWTTMRSLAALLLPLEVPAAREIVARLGMESRMGDRVGTLSGGEQQRVALARLLVQAPLLTLVDEPVSSLDPTRADDVLGLLSEIAREGDRMVVASLHDPLLAERHFDRIVGLRNGAIRFDVTASDLTAAHLESLYRLEPAP